MENGRIYAALCDIQSDIDAIAKNKENKLQNFKFRGIEDVYNEMHKLFSKHRVFSIPIEINTEISEKETTSNNKVQIVRMAISRIKYRFIADDGSNLEVAGIGEAIDYGDKSVGKSLSYAHKNMLVSMFTIPTVDNKDADKESHTLVKTYITKHQIDNAYSVAKFKGVDKETIDKKVVETCGMPIEYMTQEQFAKLMVAISGMKDIVSPQSNLEKIEI